MRILHLYSDWKWTGPAEPALQACLGLQNCGHDVLFAYRAAQHGVDEHVGMKVEELGLNGTTRFALDRYLHPVGTLRDLVALPRFIRRQNFDIVHTHLCHDHALGGLCTRLCGRHRPRIVRSLHRRDVLRPTLGYRFLLGGLTDGCLTFTESFRQQYMRRFHLAPERTAVMPMTVDLERFHPARPVRDMRSEFGIDAAAPLIGIVGRFQRYRRMETFLEAARRVLQEVPSTRFLVIGRSSKIRETVVEPSRQLGIQDQVILSGYRIEDYVDILACLDVFSLLMPGFDGTARAVREAMALGKPCVVSDFGMLPEIVPHGEAGLVVADRDPAALADAWLELIRDPDRRRRCGARARRDAEVRFDLARVGPCLDAFYRQLLALPLRK